MRPFLFINLLIAGLLPALPVDFVREVRPIFERHCYECHGAHKQKSGLRLDVKQAAMHGGEEHAPAILPGKSAESPLFRFVSGANPDISMPPKDKPALSAGEIGILKRWIDEGAGWPEGVDQVKLEDKTDWWSFKPMRNLESRARSMEARIDALTDAKLREKGLQRSPRADARMLIRRLCFDLTGLPPTPEEVHGFEAAVAREQSNQAKNNSTASPLTAYEKLVDRLLASPRYGERWARHWLDVVHYGETHGYDKDKPRPNAWPYRDYVIRALNQDKPYARFVEEQIAGDVLYPGTSDGITALGFIAAGPWDLIGHAEVPETKTDGKIARHLDRDDMVQNTLGAFCSLTVGCAQCHNHKFDPITQEDYYSLQAVFAAIDRTEVSYYADDATERRFEELQTQRQLHANDINAIEAALKAKLGDKLAVLDRRLAGAAEKKSSNPNVRPDFGYHSAISGKQEAVKWVQVDLGASMAIDKVRLLPCYDDFNKIGAGFGFPVRFKVECSDDAAFKTGVTLLWRKHDATFMNDFANPGLTAFETGGAKDDGVKGRYVRVTATKLAPRMNDYIFALAELQVLDGKGHNMADGKQVSALDSIEAPPRWRRNNLTDGIAPASRSQEDKARLLKERDALLASTADAATRAQLTKLKQQQATIDVELKKLPSPAKVYAGAIHTGKGAFAGTGASGGKPRVISVLKRGDIKQPAKVVGPAPIQALSQLAHLNAAFPNTDNEGQRRAALARWIADKNNPLTWRSIVNRVWQHHFGRALVDTPNDFGRMGAQPTHPELLDTLAVWFRDEAKGSLKALHKAIVMSETYRQGSSMEQEAKSLELDASNALLSHQNRRKLDAESVRDAILMVSGKLDQTMGGPGFQDFIITHPEHSPHYEYQLYDPEDSKTWRRSIYRFIVRSQPQPFMNVLDCADPSMRVDKRNESISSLQALALMNNGLMVTLAKHFAERVSSEASGLEARVRRAFELALIRTPRQEELTPLLSYAEHNGLENTCRVLLNLNEFSFVD